MVYPPKASAAFVAAMEDVLDLYHRPEAAAYPLVYVDERVNNTFKKFGSPWMSSKIHRVDMMLNTVTMVLAICL